MLLITRPDQNQESATKLTFSSRLTQKTLLQYSEVIFSAARKKVTGLLRM